MRNYEAMVIIDTRLEDAKIKQAVERVTESISKSGELTNVDEWGSRRLAFEINHLQEGHYIVATFKSEPNFVSELTRMLEVGEEYVRAKIVRVP